ncbi:thioredoxin-disulfide reductase [Clostridium beijerinckii]|uniref:thioredoxin-disulfide reductase n=1 Tax=Clostridium beijerinckii TaxID=1520 RepID=UPI00098CED0D|nr:thioredoxin-disulfide reductase [Clostridium beijerinckii]MBA8934090.1 thioredoxin reductase (NADPH) [Clostridium beijerinckii]NRT35990.1 thioredoxin reductase (NADPH) [Clostridium beijerinckii]NRT44583.1 thioredoxin reductase (NADPH) [Clostridium beijerinckii]NRU38284.1 thioredoxin reductase (NADPH) [Clostridium beijerinckii]NRZ21425.1 thioredoxin reductase (NADPH) [Clostridium beijerinckii]
MDDMTNSYDLIIIGGGPAGLSAAIYGGRAKLKTLVINKGVVGGLVNTTREIVNYPGYEQISGPELMKNFKKHAESFGVEFLRDEVVDTDLSLREKLITTKKGKQFLAKAVIIACGSEPRLLNITGEKRLQGNGVAYCATCDAEFFEGEHVVVVGSGDQAIEEGLYITKFARKVTVIVLHDEGILDCNKVSSEKAFNNEKMEFIWNSTIEEVFGNENVEGVKIKNLKTGNIEEINCQGVFFFVGMVPSTNFLKNSGLEVDSRGYISVNELMETSFEGVYAIGDNRVKYLRQVVSAAGDGATAAVAAERYIEEVNDFNESILKSEKRVLLLFLDALVNENLKFRTLLEEINRELVDYYRIKEVDIATKKNLIGKYKVRNVPEIIVLDHGNEIKRLKYTMDKEQLKSQLS